LKARRAQWGLTLLELLIAMAVFTVVASLGYRGLQQTITARERINHSSDQFAALQRSMLWLGRDLTNLAPRPIRDHLGDSQSAFYTTGNGMTTRVEFTHAGRTNAVGLPQSDLQRVSYHRTADGIVRRYWSRLDVMAGVQPREMQLFDNATKFDWFFLDQQNRWLDQWPPLNYIGDTTRLLPRAVRVQLELPGYGMIERTFVTGTGA